MIASVRDQTLDSWELVIVDDQSSPEHWRAIQEFEDGDRIRISQRNTAPKGPNPCRNIGLEMVRGEFVLFLDSDDLLAPWCLEERVAVFQDHPDLDFTVFPVLLFHSAPGDLNLLWNRLDQEPDDLERFLKSTPPWCMTSPLWKSTSIRQLGGLSPNLRYGTDAELHTRALLQGASYKKFPHLLPDMFVRRDETPRFNSAMTDALLDARLERIFTGTKVIRGSENESRWLQFWESQYFAELEFLIFNAPNPVPFTARLLEHWKTLPNSSAPLLVLMKAYARIADWSRDRVYLVLRLTRRAILFLMPRRLRPDPLDNSFHQAVLDSTRFEEVCERLGQSIVTSR